MNKNWTRDLLRARKKSYEDFTQEIIKTIPHVFDGIDDFMRFHELKATGGELRWDEIVYIEDTPEHDILILVGQAFYSVGTEIETSSGDRIKVTEDTKDYFSRMVRIGLPMDVISSGKKEDVFNYLEKAEKAAEEHLRRELSVIQMDQQIENDQEFDYSQLTPEQIEQLQRYNIMGKA